MLKLRRACIDSVLAVVCLSAVRGAPAQTLASKADYLKYIEPMLSIEGFGIQYSEDGAADASALYPPDNKPRGPVVALVRLGGKSTPLLIDCLSDGRLTSARFEGSSVAKAMNVPLGYICLDILMGTIQSKVVHESGCADDGAFRRGSVSDLMTTRGAGRTAACCVHA
jgi:hypothetical protein